MTIEQLQKDMIAAMKAHDKERKDAISSLVSAVKKNAMPREYSGRYGKYNDHEGTQDRAGTDRFLSEGSYGTDR